MNKSIIIRPGIFSLLFVLLFLTTLSCDQSDDNKDSGSENILERLNSGLVAYYPFNDNANDASGNDLHGEVLGAYLTTDRNGNSNSAYSFTGHTDVIIVEDNDLLHVTDEVTIAAWINLTSGNRWGSRIVDKIVSGSAKGYQLSLYNTLNTEASIINTVRFVGNEGFTNITSQEVTVEEWTHVAATYQSGSVRIYINGELVSQTMEEENVLSVNDEDLQIGNDIYGSGSNLYDPFRGKLDEIRIYNRALTEEEIGLLFEL